MCQKESWMLIWKNHLSWIWLWLWIEWMDGLYFRELLKVFNMRCCKEHLSNTVTETYIRYRLYLCFTEATAVMIHLGYRIKSLQLSFKEECFICVCMKVDFLPVWRDKNFYILVLNIYSYNITSSWYVVFVGDDKPSYSK